MAGSAGSQSASFSVFIPDVNEHGFYYNQPYTAYIDVFDQNVAFFIRENGKMDFINIDYGDSIICTYTVDGNSITAVNDESGELHFTISSDGTSLHWTEFDATFKLSDDESIISDEEYVYIYDSSLGGYSVSAINKTQSSYGTIKTGINGRPTVKIADGAFAENDNIVTLPTIPDSVTTIGRNAFYNCDSLTSVSIPDSVTIIEYEAFRFCAGLRSLVLPKHITSLEWAVFCDCDSLTNITFEGTMEQWENISKDDSWHGNLTSATEVICSDGVVSLQ